LIQKGKGAESQLLRGLERRRGKGEETGWGGRRGQRGSWEGHREREKRSQGGCVFIIFIYKMQNN
jgi:hypothetical protein